MLTPTGKIKEKIDNPTKTSIFDIIWGNTQIDDPNIYQLISHPALQRLKRIWISTYGYLFELKRNSTRYEHSMGVYLLLKHFNASIEEQIAGLIHDVSHTALSHVSTYAFLGKYEGEEFHELQHRRFFKESGLYDLVTQLGFDPEYISNENNFPLLENSLPDICADRLDYALRDGLHLQILSRQQVNKILQGLAIHNSEFVFANEESAFLYSFNFYLLNLLHYGSPAEAYFNNDFGDLVKYAVEAGVLLEEDWFSDDVYLLDKLKNSTDGKVLDWLGNYNNRMVVYEDTENPHKVFSEKLRVVNPKVLLEAKTGEVKRLTEISAVYEKIIKDYVESHKEHNLSVRVDYKEYI